MQIGPVEVKLHSGKCLKKPSELFLASAKKVRLFVQKEVEKKNLQITTWMGNFLRCVKKRQWMVQWKWNRLVEFQMQKKVFSFEFLFIFKKSALHVIYYLCRSFQFQCFHPREKIDGIFRFFQLILRYF